MRVAVDVSVFADYYVMYPQRVDRYNRSRAVLDLLSSIGAEVYEPFILDIELRSVLVRKLKPSTVLEIVRAILESVIIVDESELHDVAAEIALRTGCRAVDSYYIAAAKRYSAILITSDRVMKLNAEKAGVDSFYLLSDEDYKALIDRLNMGD